MDAWKREILNAINSRNGTASYNNICDDMRNFEQSRDKTKWGLRQIKLHIRQLLEFGDIEEIEDKVYSLTPEGRRRILEEDYVWHYSKRKRIEL